MYCTSRQGTTGGGKEFSNNINSYLARVRKDSTITLAVGFGISSPKDLDLIKGQASIGVIGSAIIGIIRENKNSKIIPKIREFVSKFKKED